MRRDGAYRDRSPHMPGAPGVAAAAGVLLIVVCGCEQAQLGQRCGTSPEPLPAEPIVAEDPVGEIVRLQRDGTCASFQCLTHRGLEPYCTRECTYPDAPDAPDCARDADCEPPNHCFRGQCRDDTCPGGFACRQIADVPKLNDALFCVMKSGCDDNFDCESLGEMECRDVGCVDRCQLPQNRDGASACSDSRLSCVSLDGLNCACEEGGTDCSDSELICQPQSTADPLPAGAVARRTYCMPVDQ